MTNDPWHRGTTRNLNLTLVLRGIAVVVLLVYFSLLVGARFA